MAALKNLDEDGELLADLTVLFLAEVSAKATVLQEAQTRDALLAESAHAIKGMVGIFAQRQ